MEFCDCGGGDVCVEFVGGGYLYYFCDWIGCFVGVGVEL